MLHGLKRQLKVEKKEKKNFEAIRIKKLFSRKNSREMKEKLKSLFPFGAGPTQAGLPVGIVSYQSLTYFGRP
jgi:hypothetical protein